MNDTAILTRGLTKFYGSRKGIQAMDLRVERGEVFGFLGPNGAGKTTTIRTLLDFIRPTKGSASIFGLDSRKNSLEIRKRVSYLPGDIALYEKMTGQEILSYLANLRGRIDWKYVDDLADRLQCNLSQTIHTLSRGNKQKIGLIQAFMQQPELIIMDEPTSGLDPLMQQEFYGLVQEVKADGRTVFISSHNMSEVEKICDRVGIIRNGELVTVEDVNTLKEHAVHQLEVYFANPIPKNAFQEITGVRNVETDGNVLRCTVMGKPDALIKVIAQFETEKISSHEPNLEDIFLSYYSKGVDYDE
ncbi:MAG: ABC transporter [SAR202 cluster bacterium Io17-Chloro-G3]|nr:MAG: ABC transporter [SAR202 cluster bacterium Io17-Chloro-G3]